ncbi:PREDICTED: interferon regulatory factor 7 isoform X2 [Ficedula albicollis]|uniref:interferon regulatory factor 7 isoform X2 n=1 Tax=Ficedula albicollis TaxID=59894 RepID=UPI0003599102|nr:PREDICTED: interferon regulatory factor 7 isoform X2 [Ficedula albicollis]
MPLREPGLVSLLRAEPGGRCGRPGAASAGDRRWFPSASAPSAARRTLSFIGLSFLAARLTRQAKAAGSRRIKTNICTQRGGFQPREAPAAPCAAGAPPSASGAVYLFGVCAGPEHPAGAPVAAAPPRGSGAVSLSEGTRDFQENGTADKESGRRRPPPRRGHRPARHGPDRPGSARLCAPGTMAAPEKEGEAQKLRFGPWLLSAIDSGSYRGLRWIDSARTIFRVPWKHNARKDITSSDLEVFKAWAKVSGRYEEGSEDPAKWKTNFRCALSSTHMFRLEYDHSKRGDDPHKVFSIVSATLQDSKEGDSSILNPVVAQQEEDSSIPNPVVAQQVAQEQLQLELHPQDMASAITVPESTDPTQLSILEELLQQCGISPRDFGSQAASWVPAGGYPAGDTPHQDALLQPHQDALLQPHQDTLLQPHQEILLQPHQDTLLQPYTDTSQNSCSPATTFPQWVEQPTYQPAGLMPPEQTGAVPRPCPPAEGTVPVQYAAEATLFAPAASSVPQPRLLRADSDGILDVTIYYRGKEFHREVVGGSHCLLTYQPPGLAEAPCPWQVVRFPSPAGVADGKQRRITEELLGVAGLQLEIRASKVFATRRKKCKVFWALSQQLEGGEEPPPNLLCRDQETPIFDFNEFCTELWDFHIGQRRRSPDFTIYLCFGQAFSKAKPKESKLILVKLVPKVCELYYEQFLQAGASSLDSHTISLQLSNSLDLMELIEQYNMQLG